MRSEVNLNVARGKLEEIHGRTAQCHKMPKTGLEVTAWNTRNARDTKQLTLLEESLSDPNSRVRKSLLSFDARSMGMYPVSPALSLARMSIEPGKYSAIKS